VTIGATGDVTGVTADSGSGGTTVTVNGKVGAGGITADATYGGNSTFTQTSTQNATVVTTIVNASTYDNTNGNASVNIASGAKVSGDVNAYAGNSATITSAGTVTGNLYAQADASKGNETITWTYDPTSGNNIGY